MCGNRNTVSLHKIVRPSRVEASEADCASLAYGLTATAISQGSL